MSLYPITSVLSVKHEVRILAEGCMYGCWELGSQLVDRESEKQQDGEMAWAC